MKTSTKLAIIGTVLALGAGLWFYLSQVKGNGNGGGNGNGPLPEGVYHTFVANHHGTLSIGAVQQPPWNNFTLRWTEVFYGPFDIAPSKSPHIWIDGSLVWSGRGGRDIMINEGSFVAITDGVLPPLQ